MARVKVSAFVSSAVQKSGITIALCELKGGQHFRIGITAAAQAEFFGGPLNPEKDAIEIILDDQPGSVHLLGLKLSELSDADALAVSSGIKGAISLKVIPWCQVAPGKRPAVSLPVVNQKKGEFVSVKLPEWARVKPRLIGQGKSLMEA